MPKTAQNDTRDLPTGANVSVNRDPDFNDPIPGSSIDPEAQEFRDEVKVTNYTTVGALQTEMENERLEAEQATLDALEAMRAMDAGEQVKWRISRVGHENDELNGYLETWPNNLMTIERIRDKFGGGTFYCKGFRKGRYISHQTLQISGDAKRKPSGDGVTQSVPVNSAPAFDLQAFMAAQERRDERRREDERREAREREERDEKRRAERMQLLLTLGPAAITALGGVFGGRQPDMTALIAAMKGPDPLTMLAQIQALQKTNQPDVMLRLLPMLLDKVGESTGTGSETGWMDVVKELVKSAGPTVGGMIEASVQAAKANAIAAQTNTPLPPPMQISQRESVSLEAPASAPPRRRRPTYANAAPAAGFPGGDPTSMGDGTVNTATASSPTGSSEGDMNLMQLMPLAPHLPWLKDQLQCMGFASVRNKDPEVYAAMFLEELPDGIDVNVVGQLLASTDWYQKLCQLDPRLNRQDILPWFTTLRGHILRSLQEETGAVQGQHEPPQPSSDPRATRQVNVRGPGDPVVTNETGHSALAGREPPISGHPAPAPKSAARSTEIERPQGLPSLTGESNG